MFSLSNLWIIVSSFVTLPSSQNQPLSAFVKGCQFDITCPHFDITCPLTLTNYMAFFEQAITVLQTLVIALGAGLGIWGVINLLEGYGNDNPGAKSQGMKQLMAGAGVAVVGMVLVPLLSGLFSV